MKKYLHAIPLLICLILLAACGREDGASADQGSRTEYYDILVTDREVFGTQPGEGRCAYYGIQRYQDEIVQIMEICDSEGVWQPLLLKEDGSSQPLLPEYSYFTGRWYLTGTGESILFYSELYGGGIRILSREGEKLFTFADMEGLSVCETEDGSLYLLALDTEEDSLFLAGLDTASGTLRQLEGITFERQSPQCLGLGPEGLMLMDCYGIWELEDNEGKVSKSLWMSFEGTTYTDMSPSSDFTMNVRDVSGFRVSEDGSVEILWNFQKSGKGLLQTLKAERVEKEILRLRCDQMSGWMAECIARFNHTNKDYYIVPEQPTLGSWDLDTLLDFRRRTDMEIGAGRGADMIIGQASYKFSALLEQGALEDLTPYLERSGIDPNDYFPITFARDEEQGIIYGVLPEAVPMGVWIRSEILSTAEGQSIETVVDALDCYPGKGSIFNDPSGAILLYLLSGSEDFWGMIDYENGTCDFDTELFRKILRVAKRYGDRSYRDSAAILGYRDVQNVTSFESRSELQAHGETAFGFIFDDGVYSEMSWQFILAINSKSSAKDACWEFISLLLQEENQRKMAGLSNGRVPSNRRAFAEAQQYQWNRYLTDENFRMFYDSFTEEDMAEQLEMMENLHMPPMNTIPVQKIIQDEASNYINDIMPIETVIENINNRVQLYLDENK